MSSYKQETEDATLYKVVVNHEDQYSIWPSDRATPPGWTDAGKNGQKAECLAYIKEVWVDMRPLSLRKEMERSARQRELEPSPPAIGAEPQIDDLVDRLCRGEHPVEVSLRPERTCKAFKERIDRGYVHLKFTDTRGGTELGVKLVRDTLKSDSADFDRQTGSVHFEGTLTLNSVKVRCIADVELPTLAGKGRLVRSEY